MYVSAASAWEAAIKLALGRLRLQDPFASLVEGSGFQELPITFSHAEQLLALPRHHADPFDRMLVAQAQVESLTLVTHDDQLTPTRCQSPGFSRMPGGSEHTCRGSVAVLDAVGRRFRSVPCDSRF